MMRLARELFAFERAESPGERLHARIYETFLAGHMVYWCWAWSDTVRTIRAVVRPLGVARYMDISSMFSDELAVLNACAVSLGALLGLTRVLPKLGYTLAFAGFHLQYVARFSLGEVCHASNFVGMGMLGLTAAVWLFEGAAERRKFTLGASYFFVGLAYASAAISKLIASGPRWVDGRNLWLWIGEKSVDAYSKHGVIAHTQVQQWALHSRGLSTLLLTLGLAIEAAGVLLWFRKTRPYIATLCIALHVNIYFAMNILFDTSIYHLVVLGLPWAPLLDRLRPRSSTGPMRRSAQEHQHA